MSLDLLDMAPIDWWSAEEHRRKLAESINAVMDRIPLRGSGDPEGAIAASVGTLYTRTDGGTGTTLYVKESGTGTTGWVAK